MPERRFSRGSWLHALPRAALRPLGVMLVLLAVAGCSRTDPLEEIRALQAAGNAPATIEPLRELIAADPDDTEVNYLYGNALIAVGQPSLAEHPLRKAIRDPEWRVRAALLLAGSALVGSNYPAAIEAANVVLEVEPDNVEALMMRANAYAHSKTDLEKALTDADRIFELDPDYLDAWEPRILALLALERGEEAGAAIEEMGRQIEKAGLEDSKLAWHCATSAIFAKDDGDIPLAVERWKHCVERFPGEPDVVWPAVTFYDGRLEFGRSLQVLQSAHDAVPGNLSYREALASRLRHAGDPDAAESLLREVTEVEDDQVRVTAWLALVKHHQALEEYEAAAEAARQAVELARKYGKPPPQLLLEYADSLLLAAHYDRALAVADEMSLESYAEMVRARVAQERGDPAQALAHYDAAFRLWPNNPWARFWAAIAAEELGDFDRAVEEYRYSIRIDAGATEARQRIGRLLIAEGKPLESLQLLRLKIEEAPLDLDGELVSLHAYGATGDTVSVKRALHYFLRNAPGQLGLAAATAAEGVREAEGAEAAADLLREMPVLDLTDPLQADALRALVRLESEAGRHDEAKAAVEAALAKHPDSAVLLAIRGRALELAGAPQSAVRAAYQEALARSSEEPHALAGLGRQSLSQDPQAALAYFERALAVEPESPERRRDVAEAMIAAGAQEQGEARLEELLVDEPYDGALALRLAELRMQRGERGAATRALAERAARFGRGSEAETLLESLRAETASAGAGSAAAVH